MAVDDKSIPPVPIIPASLLAAFVGKMAGEVPLADVPAVHAFISNHVLCEHSRARFDGLPSHERTMVAVNLGSYVMGAFSRAAPLGLGRVRLTLGRFAFPSASCRGLCLSSTVFEVHP